MIRIQDNYLSEQEHRTLYNTVTGEFFPWCFTSYIVGPPLEKEEEAKQAAVILGYNYQSGKWYERSYKVFNKEYKVKKFKKKKEMGLIRKKIKNLFN